MNKNSVEIAQYFGVPEDKDGKYDFWAIFYEMYKVIKHLEESR